MIEGECRNEGRITVLEQRDQMIIEALTELKGKTDLILMQVTKVAVLEANHIHQSEALNRAFSRIEKLETNIKELTSETREFIHTTKGMIRMAWWVWTLMGGGLGLMLMKVLGHVS